MAESTSLESQLIAGAGKAVAPDPLGLVAAAQEEAGKKLTEGMRGIATSWAAKKAVIKAQNDSNDKSWEETRAKMDENLGSLDADYWEKAGDHAEDLKAPYDACPAGKEGYRCRQREMMKLNKFITHTAEVKKVITSHKELEDSILAGDISKSNYQTNRSKAILGGLNGNQSKLGGVNDARIYELEAELETLRGRKGLVREDLGETDEMIKIQEQIDKLRENDSQEYGWNISYINDHTGEEVNERVTLKDLNDLITTRDDGVTNGMMDATNSVKDNNVDYKNGVKGSSAFDERTAAKNAESMITGKNIASVFHDDFGFGEPLKNRLKEHPVITNMKYSDLGIDVMADLDDDGIIDPEEWDAMSPEGVDQIISALSDPTHPNFDENTSLEVARSDIKANIKKESEIDLYGAEYWDNENLEYPQGTSHNTLKDKQAAIKEFFTTPQPGESKQDFIDRDGILGALTSKGITWNDETKTWTTPEYDEDEMFEKMKKDINI